MNKGMEIVWASHAGELSSLNSERRQILHQQNKAVETGPAGLPPQKNRKPSEAFRTAGSMENTAPSPQTWSDD